MKLVTIDAWPQGRTGALIGDAVLDFALAAPVIPIAGYVPVAMVDLLAGGHEGLDLVRRVVGRVAEAKESECARLAAAGALRPRSEVTLLAPVPRPGILLSHGRAYKVI